MACQSGMRKGRRWSVARNVQLWAFLLCEVFTLVSTVTVPDPGLGFGKQGYGMPARRLPMSYKSMAMSNKQQRRLKAHGNEIMPPMSSNDISEEPTCEELRAMWRYYKRQSRAEFTNEIQQFGKNPFFDMFPPVPHTPVVSSFGPVKGRAKSRMRPQNPLYGRVVYKPSKERQRERQGNRNRQNQRPLDTLRDMLGRPGGGGEERPPSSGTSSPVEPIVHLRPPAQPTQQSHFQKLKQVIVEEKLREGGRPTAAAASAVDNREFGKIVLSPPRGQDGRRANKPRELMTAFEKIRFGHADDLLDEGIRHNLDVMKRRSFPPHVLKQQLLPAWKQEKRRIQSHPMLLLATSRHRAPSSPSSRFFWKREEDDNNTQLPETTNKQQLDTFFEIQDVPALPNLQLNPASVEDVGGVDESLANSRQFVASKTTPPETVEIPTCAEVEHNSCNQTSDCSCIGFALYRCYLNQCQILPLASSVVADDEDTWPADTQSDIWHSEPLPSDKLGIWEEPVVVDATSSLTLENGRKSGAEGKPSGLTDATYIVIEKR